MTVRTLRIPEHERRYPSRPPRTAAQLAMTERLRKEVEMMRLFAEQHAALEAIVEAGCREEG